MPNTEPMEMSLDQLVTLIEKSAHEMSTRNPHRLVCLNAAHALAALGQQLEQAWHERDTLKAELEAFYGRQH